MQASRLCAVALLVVAWCACATASSGPDWITLDRAEQELLGAFAARWPHWSQAQRETLLQRARGWLALDPAARRQRLARWNYWQSLEAPQRARLRQQHALWESLSAERQQQVIATAAGYARMSPERQTELLETFQRLPPERRRHVEIDPAHAELVELARASFAFVPADERTATLAMLAELDAASRLDLRRLGVRLAPWQREALRRELLAQDAAHRPDWLRERLNRR